MDAYRAARLDGWQVLQELTSFIDQLTQLTRAQGRAAVLAQMPPLEQWPAHNRTLGAALLSILDGQGDGSWRENFDIHPTAAVELDRLAEAVAEWKKAHGG